jgi:hypothetical protein
MSQQITYQHSNITMIVSCGKVIECFSTWYKGKIKHETNITLTENEIKHILKYGKVVNIAWDIQPI